MLGNLFDKYKRFKICLTSWGQGVAPTGFTTDDLSVVLTMSGLMWENQTYDTLLNGLTSRAVIATLRYTNNGSGVENFTGEVGQVFKKENYDNDIITINVEKTSGAAFPALVYPQCCYVFSIYGIPDEIKI